MTDGSITWLIGGAQGSGVDSAASMMGRACALSGLWVLGRREYHSNIMGLHSYFQLRTSGRPVRSPLDQIDLLVTFDEETLFRHSRSVARGGGILYDPTKVAKPLDQVPSFHGFAAQELRAHLERSGIEPTPAGVLKEAEDRGVHLYPFPFQEVLAGFSRQAVEIPSSRVSRAVNTAAVAASLALLRLPRDSLGPAVNVVFAAKPEVAELNRDIGQYVYDEARSRFSAEALARVPTPGPRHGKMFLTGTQAVAIGKMLGGCRFQTYYPITPASDESEFLESHATFPLVGPAASGEAAASVLVVQTEDEIAALTMAMGAALAGARAATSTSGPGFSLMTEGLGFGGMDEVPVVVTLYQRAGPSTGLPTRHEQGDLRFALHAGQGEFPRIVLASGDIEECLFDAVRCLNYAARYQVPVLHLIDKALASTTGIVPIPDPSLLRLDRGSLYPGAPVGSGYAPYRRFALTASGVSPRAPLGTPGTVSWHTSDEHGEDGHIDEDPENRRRMMEKRAAKLRLAVQEIPPDEQWRFFGPPEARVVVVSWGSTKGPILDALETLAARGVRVGFLQVRLLHPFPSESVARLLAPAERRIVVEMNYSGQLAGLITEKTRMAADTVIVKFNGRQMSEGEVVDALVTAAAPAAPARMVLTGGC